MNVELAQPIFSEQAEQTKRQIPRLFVTGQKVTTEGVPTHDLILGHSRIGLYVIPDFLRQDNGSLLCLNSHEATCEIAAFNEQPKINQEDGYEASIMQKLNGDFKDGTIFLSRAKDLEKLRERLPIDPQLDVMRKVVEEFDSRSPAEDFGPAFAVSSTESRGATENAVTLVCLGGSAYNAHSGKTENRRDLVVGFRAYRLG